MKHETILKWAFPVLGIVLVGVSMFFLPDVIPLQIGLSGEYTRFGSKFILFLIPAINALLCFRQSAGAKGTSKSTRYYVIVGILFIGVEIFGIIMGLNYRGV